MGGFVKSLHEVRAKDVAMVGGKGANLGEMAGAGFPVPPGFCITAEAYRKFISQIDICDVPADLANIALKSREISERILSEKIPEELAAVILNAYNSTIGFGCLVAVRSSATAEDLPEASFAGQQESFLNVDEKTLLESVKKCWASLWTERAIHYRINNGFEHNKVYLAVVVQQMVSSEAAGVAFSINPLTLIRSEIVIESVWGLGEGIVSGQVTPDRFIVNKTSREILLREISEKEKMVIRSETGSGTKSTPTPGKIKKAPSLTDAEVMELAKLVCAIEEHYGFQQDVEWAFAGNQFYILQSRPVTTLNPHDSIQNESEPSFFNFDPDLEWTNEVVKERYHQPLSVLGWSIIEPCQSEGFRLLCEMFSGRKYPSGYKFYSCIYGYMYLNFTVLKEISPSFALGLFLESDKKGAFKPKHSKLREIMLIIKGIKASIKMNAMLDKAFHQMLPGYLKEIEKLKACELNQLSEFELYEYILASRELGRAFFKYQLASAIPADNLYNVLTKLMVKWLHDDGLSVSAKLVSGLPNNLTVETNNDVWRLALTLRSSPQLICWLENMSTESFLNQAGESEDGRHFIFELNKLLEKHAHLNTNMDVARDFWWENPDIVLSMVRGFLSANDDSNPAAREREKRKTRKEAEDYVRSKLSPVKRYIFNKLLPPTQTYMLLRDTRHYYITMPFFLIKKAIKELARRLKSKGVLKEEKEIFYLTIDEIGAIVSGNTDVKSTRNLLVKRKAAKRIDIDALPSLFKGWPQVNNASAAHEDNSEILKGIGGSPGITSGPVKVIRSLNDFARFKAGDVLVAINTDPAWTPLFAIAGAVVTDYGGLLSHGAIVAREYGIPAVLDTKNATSILKDGQYVVINGNNGSVSIKNPDENGKLLTVLSK